MNDKEEIQALKEWVLSTSVQKDACSDRHEKAGEKINTLICEYYPTSFPDGCTIDFYSD